MNFLNSIFYKSLVALYSLNTNKDGRAKDILIDAVFEGLVCGKEGLDEAKLEMALETATENWLDYWGNHYGVPRIQKIDKKELYLTIDSYQELKHQNKIVDDIYYKIVTDDTLLKYGYKNGYHYNSVFFIEPDDAYRKRIIEEIISPKNTLPALKGATTRYLKYFNNVDTEAESVDIFEPWTQLLKFDERGVLDGPGRMVSYDYWNYAVLDISIPDSSLISKGLIEYLNRVKAGGVKIVFTISPHWDIAIDPAAAEKVNNTWYKIDRETMMLSKRTVDGFRTLQQGDLSLVDDITKGGQLDIQGVLEGRQQVYWDGVEVEYSWYASGLIRNPFNSAVLSLEDYKKIAGKESLTIEEAALMEEDAIFRRKVFYSYTNSKEVDRKTHEGYGKNIVISQDDYTELYLTNKLNTDAIYHITSSTDEFVTADRYTELSLSGSINNSLTYNIVKNREELISTITKDGILTMTQSYLSVFHEWSEEITYIPYSRAGEESTSVFEFNTLDTLRYVKEATMAEIEGISPSIDDIEIMRIINEPGRNTQILSLLQRDVVEGVKADNYDKSLQNQIVVEVSDIY